MSVLILPNRFRQQPQYAAPLDKGHWFGSKATFAITGALPDFNAATGRRVSITGIGSGFSVRTTTRGKSLYTPDDGWANLGVEQDWAGPNTIIALCRVNNIDNPWGGLFSKDTGSGTSTQFGIGRYNLSDSLYGSVDVSTAVAFGGESISTLADFSVIAFTHSGVTSTAMSYYRNGMLIGSTTALPEQPSGSGVLGLGRSRDQNPSYDSDVDWIAFLRAPFVAAPAQIKELSDNIWAVWKASERRIFIASAATSHDLSVGNATQTNAASTGSISQAHVLSEQSSAQANASAADAITQAHTLTGSASTQGNSASSGEVTQGAQFAADSVTQANTAGIGAITQTHALVAAGSTQSNTASATSIAQAHALAGTSATQANTASQGAISQGVVHDLSASAATQANSGAAGTITQAHVLVCPASIQDNIAAASAIVQAHVLAALSATQGNSASSGAITAGDNVLVSVVERTATFRRSKSVTVRFN